MFLQHDIREAPRNIVDSYKMYYKLKSSFLEDTLNDVLDEDGFDLSLEGSQLDSSASERSHNFLSLPADFPIPTSSAETSNSFSNIAEIGLTSLTNLRNVDNNHVIKEFEAETVDDYAGSLNKDAWGQTLNKVVKPNPSSIFQTKPASQEVRKSVTNKLFKNSSFSVRNPRKSFSRNNSTIVTSNINQQIAARDILPDLESILVEKAKKQMDMDNHDRIVKPDPIKITQSTANLHVVDSRWLNRCTDANSLGNVDDKNATNGDSQTVKYGLLNLNVKSKPPEKIAQVQSTPSLGLSSLTIKDKAPTLGSVEIYSKPTYDNTYQADDDDDEVIENSEDESTAANISSLRHIAKKRKIEDVKPKEASPETVVLQPTIIALKPVKKLSKIPKKSTKRSTSVRISPKISSSTRRSTRNMTRTIVKDSSGSEWDEVDSDNDPEFKISKQDLQKESLHDENDETNQPILPKQKKEKPTKANVTKTKKDKITKAKSKDSAAKIPKGATRKIPVTHQPYSKRKPFAQSTHDENMQNSEMEEDNESPPQDYMPEFGSGHIQSVPRININDLQASTQAFEQYVHTSQPPQPTPAGANPNQTTDYSQSTANYDALEKRAKDRLKMEKKIASGTLNENFVRINIQKKVFSRGHKSVNFSRYKKNQWKKTKAAAALAGPEMDMRGCDGGFLVCFQCGQQGHFAQDCKVQGAFFIY